MKNLITPCLLLLIGGCGVTGSPVPAEDLSARLSVAEKLLTDGDPDGTLLITDKLLNDHPELRAARVLAAQANVALVRQRRETPATGRLDITPALLADAARNFELALAKDPADYQSWMQLSWVRSQRSEFEDAADAARKAIELAKKPDQRDQLAAALLAAADAEMQMFVRELQREAKPEGGGHGPRTLLAGQKALATLALAKRLRPGEAYLKSAYVFAYLGKTLDELNELKKGVLAAADHFPLHARLRQVRGARGEHRQLVATYRQILRDDGPDASINFALGQAQSELADKLRKDGDREGAQGAYLEAIKAFEACRAARPEWKDSCDHWLAVEYIALAKINEQAGNTAAGKAFLEQAYAATPRVLDHGDDGRPVIRDAFEANYEGILNQLGQAAAAKRSLEALRDGLALWVGFTELHPGRLGWLYNNAAFTARDLGAMVEARAAAGNAAVKEQAAKEAMAIYEQSYRLYLTAVELSPDDPRVINDAGLMLIYHLHREYPKAREYFDEAIRVGTGKLAALPEDTGIEQRQTLEEAVGDAWQNIGKMLRDVGKPFTEYEAMLQQAVKYYPYQRREAARWLRTKGQAQVANAAAPNVVDPRAAAFAAIQAAARQKADAADFDGALLILDEVAKKMHGFLPFHLAQGRYSFDYATQAAARGGSAGQIDGLYADARAHLQKAVELDGEPIEPRLLLARANYASGEYVNAAKIAAALLNHISSRGGTTDDLLAEAHRLRAQAGYKVFVAAKEREQDDQDELSAARNSFRALDSMNRVDASLRTQWSVMERWAGNNSGALEILVRALARQPDDQKLLDELVSTARSTGQSALAGSRLADRKDALGVWYRGVARYDSTFQAPTAGHAQDAIEVLDGAIADFRASAEQNASYQPSCRTYIASCQAMQGFHALDAGRHAAAEPYFLAAAQTAPERATTKLSGERSVKTGIELIVHHHYTGKNLQAAIKTLQKACAVLPDDPGLANNLGLFARDQGNALERQGGDKAAATQLYEVSYQAYKNAVRLEPESIRQKNDLIVILLYHLHRELDWAKQTLEECAVAGRKQLEDAAPDDPQELQDLQETVGDCYQNLGYYHLNFSKDREAARENLQTSLKFHPFAQRASTRLLRQLDRPESGK